MRRLLIILLLTLLPLQASWAAVCAYCPDDCTTEFSAGAGAAEAIDDEIGLDNDDECSRCHMGGAGIASSLMDSGLVPHPGKLASRDGSPFPDSGQSDRPERPNWMRAA